MNKIVKTILLILIAVAGVSLPAFASYIPFNTNVNMNVGIGTSTPQGALVVMNGNVGIGTWIPRGKLDVEGTLSLAIFGGNVGIGTWVTRNPLDVIAVGSNDDPAVFQNINASGGSDIGFLSNTGVGELWIGYGNPSSSPYTGVGFLEYDSNDFEINYNAALMVEYFTNTGNIGIGTTTPVGALTVMNGNVGIGTWIPALMLDVNGTVRMTGLTLTGNGAANGNVLVGNSVGVGTWMPVSTLGAAGGSNYWLLNGGAGNVGINTSYAVGIGTSFVGGTGEAVFSVMKGNVGIGTWVPSSLFVVGPNSSNNVTIDNAGNLYASTNITAFNAFSIANGAAYLNWGSLNGHVIASFSAAAPNYLGFSINDTASYQMVMDNNGNVGIGTYNPFGGGLIVTNGNVGIGSLTPGQLLDVQGTVRMKGLTLTGNGAGNGNVLVGNSVGVGTWMPVSTLGAAGGSNYWLLNGGAGNVGINTSYAVGIGTSFVGGTGEGALSIMNGNVGIGTWVPAENLDISASGGGALQLENTNLTIPNYSSLGSNITTHTIGIIADNGTTYGGLAILGFNTNPPNSFQDMPVLIQGIFGNTNTNSLPAIAFSGGKTNGGTGVTNLANSDILAQFENNNTGLVTILGSGNVGIGTLSPFGGGLIVLPANTGNVGIGSLTPGQALDVNGTVRMTGLTLTGNGAANGNVLVGNSVGVGTWMPASTLATSGGTNYWNYSAAGNIGVSTIRAVGIGTTFIGGTGEAALSVMNGNVGIGTWLPAYSLDVENSGGIYAYTLNTGQINVDLNGGVGVIFGGSTGYEQIYGSGASTPYGLYFGTGGNIQMTIFGSNVGIGTITPNGKLIVNGGNVGIGSLTPGQVLDVTGTVRMTGLTLTGNGAGNGNVLVGNAVGVGTWMPASSLATSVGSNYWLNDTTGNVGISTTYAVGIGTSFVGGTGEAAFAVMRGNVGIGTWVPAYPLDVETTVGNAIFGNTADDGGIGVLGQDTGFGYGVYGESFSGVGVSAESEGDQTALSASNYGTGPAAVFVQGNVGIGTFTPEGALTVIVGNVGIGTWIPGNLLQINGPMPSSSSNLFTVTNSLAPSGYLAIGNSTNGTNEYQPQITGQSAGYNGNALILLGMLPAAQDVVNGGDGVIDFQAVRPGGAAIQNSPLFSFFGAGAPVMLIDKSGNVGIGTINPFGGGLIVTNGNVGIGTLVPGQLLDINGTARMRGFTLTGNGAAAGNVLVSNAIGVGTWMPTTTLPVGTLTSGTTNQVAYYSGALTLSSNSAMVFNAPNVGLGTVTPLATLQVVGNIGIGTVKNGDNFISTAPPNGGFIVEGNVGVGSWAPGQKLDVQGTLRALGELVNGNVGIGTTFINGAGEGALTVMNGNVGIGTWVPSSPLAVEGAMTSIVPNATGTITAFEYNGVNEPGTYMEVGNTTSDTETNFYMVDPYSSNGHQVASEIAVATDINLGDANEYDEFLWVNPGLKIAYLGSEQENGNNAGGAGLPLLLTTQNNDAAGVYIGSNAGQNVGIGTTTPAGGFVVMNGNVGIGTWVPAGQLDIEGTLSVAIFHGNVGIGTATVPAYDLDLVNGTARQRNVRRVNTAAGSSSPIAINSDTTDLFTITALAQNSVINITAGTPNNGDLLEVRILDNGTARTLTWGSAGATIASTTTTLPATTVISTTLRVLLEYNSAAARWECIGVT